MKNSKKSREAKRENYRKLLEATRKVFHLSHDADHGWVLRNDKGLIVLQRTEGDENKKKFVSRAAGYVRSQCNLFHHLGQLVVHKLDGQIEFEYTYGLDPKRSKG